MANKTYPLPGFYFKVSFNGEDSAFQEVTGISTNMGVEPVDGGGENRFKHQLPGSVVYQNLILKRAVTVGSVLIDWCTSCIEGGFTNQITTHDIVVSLLDASATVAIKWIFHNAYPVKYAVADLKSQNNALVIESIELAYTHFEIAPTA